MFSKGNDGKKKKKVDYVALGDGQAAGLSLFVRIKHT